MCRCLCVWVMLMYSRCCFFFIVLGLLVIEMGMSFLDMLVRKMVFYFRFLVECSEVSVMFLIVGVCWVVECLLSLVIRLVSVVLGCLVVILLVRLVSVCSDF